MSRNDGYWDRYKEYSEGDLGMLPARGHLVFLRDFRVNNPEI